MSSETDLRLMDRALDLAAKGVGQVSPGPLVGCVIASRTGEVLGEGFYVYDDLKHAETLALEQAGERAVGSTAYVSLEPHAHHGRTPPCTTALISAGIKRVVAPIEDPNPEVSGRGFEHLRAMRVEVCVGVRAREAERLNEKYLHFMRTGRPFVHLKLAASLDGKIATRTLESRWITGAESRARVHQMRHEYDAIMIGASTAIADNPLLTDRSGRTRRRSLTRVVLDGRLQLLVESKLAQTAKEAPVLLFAGDGDRAKKGALESVGIEVLQLSGRDLDSVLAELANRSLQSVLVEGGAELAGSLVDQELVNKVTFFISPLIIGGRDAPNAVGGTGAEKISNALRLKDIEIAHHGPDLEVTGYPAPSALQEPKE